MPVENWYGGMERKRNLKTRTTERVEHASANKNKSQGPRKPFTARSITFFGVGASHDQVSVINDRIAVPGKTRHA